MKEIAIYTIQDANYGNRLQNFATTVLLKRLNVKPVTIRTTCPSIFENSKCLTNLKIAIRTIIKRDRFNAFNRFNSKLKYTKDYIAKDGFKISENKYDVILVGSDQIWNMNFGWLSTNAFLPFPHERKIAFAASFGVDDMAYNQEIADSLNDFKAISVREEAGVQIIKKLTGRDASVLVDPTMMLTTEDWRKVSRKPRGANSGYILTYFLSEKCNEAKKQLEQIRDGRRVYELLNPNDKVADLAGPSEFLWLFDNADIILTDSFHACVFAFLFDKPFLVYDRNWDACNMNSRLETLLQKFHLERKYVNSGLENDIWEHDYSEGYQQLELERKKALDFLKNALGE